MGRNRPILDLFAPPHPRIALNSRMCPDIKQDVLQANFHNKKFPWFMEMLK